MTRRRSKSFGSVTLWAWVISLALHGILFAVLFGYRPSFAATQARIAAASAADLTQARVRRLPPQPVTRKPQIRKLVSIHQQPSVRPVPIDLPAPVTVDLSALPSLPSSSAPADAGFFTEATEFFGQLSADRKICYVVDASGSMFGRFDPVRTQLQQSLSALAQDQYFYIIFFQDGDKLPAYPDTGRFVRASPAAVQAAFDFIATIRPKGATNAVDALRRGMTIRDFNSQGPGLIYFLTDGFDLQQGDEGFARRIENLRKTLAPRTKINTIGFRTESTDLQILRDIAAFSGGQFTSVE